METCLVGTDEQSQAIRQYEEALLKGDNEQIAHAVQKMDVVSAWDFEDRFKQILSQLKITDIQQRISQKSFMASWSVTVATSAKICSASSLLMAFS